MIKFPTMHIAESVKNRILNAADEIDAEEIEQTAAFAAPSIPEAKSAGVAIDVKLATPPGPVSAPPELSMQDVVGPASILGP